MDSIQMWHGETARHDVCDGVSVLLSGGLSPHCKTRASKLGTGEAPGIVKMADCVCSGVHLSWDVHTEDIL